jgi:rubrerythrin
MNDREEATKHGNELEKAKLNEIIYILNTLANLELSFAELYEACGKHWDNDAKFWLSIAQEERNHNVYVNKMSELVSQFPNQFTLEKPFIPISLMTTRQMTKTVIQKINSSQITLKEILNIALDIEKSILETNYIALLKTNNKQYQDLAKSLVKESDQHKEMILQKIDELYKGK